MPSPASIAVLRNLVLIACAAPFLQGQSAPPSDAARREEEEATVLSPFRVGEDRAVGFAATSTLSAGRLATELRDSAAAFSVATREFIEALGLTDLQSTATWMTGTAEAPDNGQQLFFNNPVYYIVRGTRASRQQRNYFPQFNDLDTYNVERFDFGRGPNAILYGNGTLGGVSSASTVVPSTRAFSERLEASFGSWSRARVTTDTNVPLSDSVAVRVDTLWGDAQGWRDKEMDRRRGAFLSGLWRPARNSEVRVDLEYVENARQVGFTTLADQLSGWDGVTTFNTPQALRTFSSSYYPKGVARANYQLVYNPYSGDDAILNMQNTPITLAGGATSTTPAGGYVSGASPTFNLAGSNILYELNAPENRFAKAEAGSFFRVPSESFTLSPDAPLLSQRFKDAQLTFTHRAGPLVFEVAGDSNRAKVNVYGEQNRGLGDTFIDIVSVTPTGRANPNFLQPYADAMLMRSFRGFNYDNLRAAAAGEWRWPWLRLTANVMGGLNDGLDDVDYQYVSMASDADHRYWHYQYTLVRRYWNETRREIPDLTSHTVVFNDPVAGTVKAVQPSWIPDTGRTDTEAVNRSTFRYGIASMNLRLLRERLVLLGAVRRDWYYFGTRQQVRPGDYPVDWDGRTVVFKPDAPADYATLTYRSRDAAGAEYGPVREAVNRPRNGILADSRYAGVRFKDDYNPPAQRGAQTTRNLGAVVHLQEWCSPFANFSESFNPNTFTTRINGSLIEPTVTTGFDYGLRLGLPGHKAELRVTQYSNRETNSVIPSDGPGYFNVLYDANIVGDLSPYGRNQRGIAPLPIQYRDRRTRIAEGTEFELTANPLAGLRFTANLAFPKVWEEDVNPDVRTYIDENQDLFRQIANDAGVLIDSATNVARVDTTIPLSGRSPDAGSAAQAYNDIQAFRKGIVSGRRIIQDQPVLNAFADYTVQTGVLRSLRIGAGVRCRARQIVGNRGADTIRDPSAPARAIDDPSAGPLDPVYSPNGYTITTGTLGYAWRLRAGGTLSARLVVDNLLDKRGPAWSSTAQVATVMRPRDGDYTSPARVAVARYYALLQPRSFNLSLTLSL